MPLSSKRVFIIVGLLAPSIALGDEAITLKGADSISEASLSAWKTLNPAFRVSVVQFALNGVPLPDLHEMVIKRDGGLMFSVRALVKLAEGDVFSSSRDRLGFYLESPGETIDVFPAEGVVLHGGKEFSLDAEDWTVIDDIEYIDYLLLRKLASFDVTFREAEGIVEIETKKPWPRQQRILRELQWSRLANLSPTEPLPAVPLALPYELTGAPQADISLSWHKESNGLAEAEYSVNAVSEAFYMTNVVALSGSLEQGLSNLRIQTGRSDLNGSVFGINGLYEFQAGDVTGISLPIIGGAPSGRGIVLRAAPLDQDQGFEETEISGNGPTGWDLELYVSGSLFTVGRVGEDGRYLFKDVPLRYGTNDFRVVMYGPNGQTREENFQKVVGGNMLRPDELHMYGYMAQSGRQLLNVGSDETAEPADLVGALRLDYGVSSDLTLSSFIAHSEYLAASELPNTQRRLNSNYVGIEARPALNFADVEAGWVNQTDGGYSAYTRVNVPLGPYSLSSSISYYGPGFHSSSNQYGSDWIRRRLRMRSSFTLNDIYSGGLVGLSMEKIDLYSKSSATLASVSFSHRLGKTFLNHNIATEHYRNVLLNSSSYKARYRGLTSTRLSDVGLRSEINYDLSGIKQGFESLGLHASWTHSNGVSINGSYFYMNGGNSTMELRVSKEFKKVLLSLSLTRSASNQYSLNAGINFSLGYTPSVGANFGSEPQTPYSQATARIFHDKNDNGVFDEDTDEGVQNATVFFNNIKTGAISDGSGIIHLEKLPITRIQNIRINADDISDNFLVPRNPSFAASLRQGQVHHIPFALTEMGEISGTIGYAADTGPLGNISLQILSEDGKVFQETTTLSDGYFYFDKLFSGTWTIRLNPKQIDQFKILSMQPKQIQLAKEKLFQSNINLTIKNSTIQ